MSRKRYGSLYERLVANSAIPEGQNETTGCWQWTGRTDKDGYGQINVRRAGKHVTLRAHRVMAEIVEERELCPETETVDHRCFKEGCINPDHFVYVTRAVNTSLMRKRVCQPKQRPSSSENPSSTMF